METAITEDLQYCDPVLGTRRSIEDLSTRALKKAELKSGSGGLNAQRQAPSGTASWALQLCIRWAREEGRVELI